VGIVLTLAAQFPESLENPMQTTAITAFLDRKYAGAALLVSGSARLVLIQVAVTEPS